MARKLLPKQDIRRAAGRLVVCGFAGTKVTPELKELVREVQPLGLILFARNIESPEQLCELNRELKALRKDEPLFLSVDQEGGRVARIRKPATEWPAMRRLGQLGDDKLVERIGRALAQELRAMNFDLDYAPVLDVDTNPKNPVIGDRSFSEVPATVAKLGAALIRGLQGAGVGACGKHFPGHGDTDKDSHLDLPFVEHELPRLREVEWLPFRAAIAANVSSIMTAHVVVKDLDENLPATLSPKVLRFLREELAYKGVIVSDDLEMKAVADRFSLRDMADKGLNAGVDVFLACNKYEVTLELYRSIVNAVEDGRVSHDTIIAADKRVRAWRQGCYVPAQSWRTARTLVGPSCHGGLLEEIDRRLGAGV
jgi:beta-N-acetylhexosaminidase